MLSAAQQLRMLLKIRGESVVLSDGTTEVPLKALRGVDEGKMTGDDGIQTKFTTVDWLIVAEDTKTLGMPAAGYTVTVGDQVYTVGHPDPKQPACVFRGLDETTYRVHTVREP